MLLKQIQERLLLPLNIKMLVQESSYSQDAHQMSRIQTVIWDLQILIRTIFNIAHIISY